MPPERMSLLQGTLDVLVLRALSGEPRHGYGVAEWVRRRTGGALDVEEGALYTSLHRLRRRGWLESSWGLSENNRRARYYALTEAGRAGLEAASREWSRYARAMARALAPEA